MAARRQTALLPSGAVDFLRRRLHELIGAALILVAIVLLLMMVTYDASDPSYNTASGGGKANNLFGLAGAVIADLALQTLGAAAALVVPVLAGWGVLLVRRRPVARPLVRFSALLLMLLLGALAFATLPAPESWPLNPGLGGLVGSMLLAWLADLSGGSGILTNPLVVGAATGIATAFLVAWLMGFTPAEWRTGYARVIALTGAWGKPAPAGRKKRKIGGGREEPFLAYEAGKPAAGSRPASKPNGGSVLEKPKLKRRPAKASQASFNLEDPHGEFHMPPLDLLEAATENEVRAGRVSDGALEQNARLLEQVLADFGVRGEIVKVRPGPVVTLYELAPAAGIKTSRVIGLSDDIARSMSALSTRIATIPGRNVIGIELPNAHRQTVLLRELLAARDYEASTDKLPLALGKDISGAPVIVDLARMPHLLVAGTTGSGKSVGLNAMVLSLLYRLPPKDCKFIMIDPKMLELAVYDDIPHLITPVVTDPKKAVVALKWTVREMEERYRSMSKLGVRNIEGYNTRLAEARKNSEVLMRRVQTGFDADTGRPVYEDQPLDLNDLPYIVVVVDEMADLMMVAGKEIEGAIQRLSQMARAAGIHLIMATQRPSVDVVTGTIKANFPTRVSFQVTSKIDSRTILGEQGAEQLLGQGDMLYMAGGGRITRVHGPYVDDDEVEAVVGFLKEQGAPTYIEGITDEEEEAGAGGFGDSGDEMYDRAVELVAREGRASTSFIQRHLQIGYNRAARIIEQMEKAGLVSAANHVGKREVLLRGGDDY